MANEKDLEQKKPGEQPPGKFHYNPGNMAGKTVNDRTDPDGERTNSDATVAPATGDHSGGPVKGHSTDRKPPSSKSP